MPNHFLCIVLAIDRPSKEIGNLTMRLSMPGSFILSSMVLLAAASTKLSAQSIETRVDSSRHEVVIEAGPFEVPAMDAEMLKEMEMDHSMHHEEEARVFRFDWPVDGPGRAFKIEIRDTGGAVVPRSMLHHLIAINFDRRQLIYQQAERLFGIGRESQDVTLPGTLVVPLERGQRLGFYVAWHNDTGRDLHGARVRIAITWIPREAARAYTPVLPVYFDVDNEVGNTNTFAIPPGKSSKAFDFTVPASGYLIAVTGHLHDYGRSVRLEDAETGKVMVSLTAKTDAAGKIIEIPRKFFLLRPLRMRAGHHYRIVAEYDSPLHATIVEGAMANILGVFAPDSRSQWPAIDPEDPTFKKDIASLPLFVPDTSAPDGKARTEFITYSQRPPH